MIASGPNGEELLIDLIYHDSNEEPESACVNRMVSTRVGNVVYQRSGEDWKAAVKWALEKSSQRASISSAQAPIGGLSFAPPPTDGASLPDDGAGQVSAAPRRRHLVTVVITSYAQAFEIDWDSVVSPLSKARTWKQNTEELIKSSPSTEPGGVIVFDAGPATSKHLREVLAALHPEDKTAWEHVFPGDGSRSESLLSLLNLFDSVCDFVGLAGVVGSGNPTNREGGK